MRRLITAAAGLGLMFSIAAGAVNAGGPPTVGFYVDGTLYRTVGTPTDFTGTGAPRLHVRQDLRVGKRAA